MAQDQMTDLKSLVAQLELFYAEHAAFDPIYKDAIERRENEISRRIGFPTYCGFRTDEEARAYLDEMGQVDKEMGIDILRKKSDEIFSRLDPVVKKITTINARELAEVALKANAVATVLERLWESPPEDLDDYEVGLVRDLIEDICAVAGVHLVVNKRLAPRSDLN